LDFASFNPLVHSFTDCGDSIEINRYVDPGVMFVVAVTPCFGIKRYKRRKEKKRRKQVFFCSGKKDNKQSL